MSAGKFFVLFVEFILIASCVQLLLLPSLLVHGLSLSSASRRHANVPAGQHHLLLGCP
jgi:hypothetical protein